MAPTRDSWAGSDAAGTAALIARHYTSGVSAAGLAARISLACRETVSRGAILGLYHRHPQWLASCPLAQPALSARRKPRAPRAAGASPMPAAAPATDVAPEVEPVAPVDPLPCDLIEAEIAALIEAATVAAWSARGRPLAELGPQACRWPVTATGESDCRPPFGQASAQLFCGLAVPETARQPYCATHRARGVEPARGRAKPGPATAKKSWGSM